MTKIVQVLSAKHSISEKLHSLKLAERHLLAVVSLNNRVDTMLKSALAQIRTIQAELDVDLRRAELKHEALSRAARSNAKTKELVESNAVIERD